MRYISFLFVIMLKFSEIPVYLFVYPFYRFLELGFIKITLLGVDRLELAAVYGYQFPSKKVKPLT